MEKILSLLLWVGMLSITNFESEKNKLSNRIKKVRRYVYGSIYIRKRDYINPWRVNIVRLKC